VIVTWLSLDERHRRGPVRIETSALLATAILVMTHIHIPYFPPDSARELGSRAVRKFLREMRRGTLSEAPRI
jgi:hypothetical protein